MTLACLLNAPATTTSPARSSSGTPGKRLSAIPGAPATTGIVVDSPGTDLVELLFTRYEQLTGITLHDREWYRAFQTFKMSVIMLVGSMLFDGGFTDDQRCAEMSLEVPFVTRLGCGTSASRNGSTPDPSGPGRSGSSSCRLRPPRTARQPRPDHQRLTPSGLIAPDCP